MYHLHYPRTQNMLHLLTRNHVILFLSTYYPAYLQMIYAPSFLITAFSLYQPMLLYIFLLQPCFTSHPIGCMPYRQIMLPIT